MLEAVGWLGNVAFFSRFFVQWLASEKAGKSVAPIAFWWLSLTGSLCLGAYTFVKDEPILLAGHVLNGALFARNLMLGLRPRPAKENHWGTGALALVLVGYVLFISFGSMQARWGEAPTWLLVSVLGQLVWSSRFILQWWMSETKGRSYFPVVFWWISLIGNGLLLAYTSHLGDPVLIAGYLPGPLVQARNLMLGQGPKSATTANPKGDPAGEAPPSEPS